MFGRTAEELRHEVATQTVRAPKWARQLADKYFINLHWVPKPNSKSTYVYGYYLEEWRWVVLYVPPGASEIEQKVVLLHEIAHHRVFLKYGRADPEIYRGKRSAHGPIFGKMVAQLYQEHGLLEEALKRASYKQEKLAIQELLSTSKV